jgi:hypothetical protein
MSVVGTYVCGPGFGWTNTRRERWRQSPAAKFTIESQERRLGRALGTESINFDKLPLFFTRIRPPVLMA